MASTTVLVVSMANSVPISGRSARPRARLSALAMPPSSSTMALAPVTDTMRPIDTVLLLRLAARALCAGDMMLDFLTCPL